ncbi:hypothetical protein ABK040_006353 [Willaertia magna]
MTDYKGGQTNRSKILLLEKQREEQLETFEKIKQEVKEKSKLSSITSKFSTDSSLIRKENKKSEIKDELVQRTIGLVTLEDFMEKKKALEKEKERNLKKREKKKQKEAIHLLSFQDELKEEEEELINLKPEFKKIKTDPLVDTSYLPDRERELKEQLEIEQIRKEWIEKQEKIKNEDMQITYSYWDGKGHRRSVVVKKGTTIEAFLYKIQLEWQELRRISVSDLMFVKEDLIIPHHYSFYDLIVNKAKGKTGVMFRFDVHDDVRNISDATKEKQDAHPSKVLDRRYFEKHKSELPYCKWEVYDPKKHIYKPNEDDENSKVIKNKL